MLDLCYRFLVLSAVAIVCCCGGCGGGLARVDGVVRMDGETVRETQDVRCRITFKPVAGGPAATGSVDANGRFRLTSGAAKGLPPGDYLAAVRVIRVTPPPQPGGYAKKTPLSPRRYASTANSGLRFSLTAGRNDIEIALESGGES